MNKTDLISALREMLNRPNLPEASANLFLEMATARLNRALKEHPRMQVRTYWVVDEGTTTVQLPEGCLQAIDLYTDAGRWNQYPPAAKKLMQDDPCGYMAIGHALEFNAAQSLGTIFWLDYQSGLDGLNQPESSNWISNNFPDIYIYAAMLEAAIWLKDKIREDMARSELSQRVDELMMQGAGSVITTAPVMVPV